jgi:hypothetical protein
MANRRSSADFSLLKTHKKLEPTHSQPQERTLADQYGQRKYAAASLVRDLMESNVQKHFLLLAFTVNTVIVTANFTVYFYYKF